MGQKNAAESLIALVDAFHARRTWRQDELAESLGVQVRTARVALHELLRTGRFPLERSEDGKHVYWSLPKNWVPGGISIPDAQVPDLVRILARAPRVRSRDKLLAHVLAGAPARAPRVSASAVLAPERSEHEDGVLATLEQAASERLAVALQYASATSGAGRRHVSVHRVDAGPPARFVAHCHRAKELRWFRADRVASAVLDPAVAFVPVEEAAVARFVASSVDGYHGAAREIRCVFLVREPDARWAEGNLLAPMRAERTAEGLLVTVETSALERVARFVVGFGGAAVVHTDELRAAVRALAEGALAANAR